MRLRSKSYIKRHKLLVSIVSIILVAILFVAFTVACSGIKREGKSLDNNNPFITSRCKIIASGVADTAPPDTLYALYDATDGVEYKVDYVELPLRLTKDGVLMIIGDDTLKILQKKHGISAVSDVEYSELSLLNTADDFLLDNGDRPYRGMTGVDIPFGIRLLTLRQLLQYLLSIEVGYMFSLKDKGELGTAAVDELFAIITEFRLTKTSIMVPETKEIGEYIDRFFPLIYRAASDEEAAEFFLNELFNLDLSKKKIKYDILLFKSGSCVVDFSKKAIVDYAHRYGLAVQYRVGKNVDINFLKKIGADGIITDSPEPVFKKIY